MTKFLTSTALATIFALPALAEQTDISQTVNALQKALNTIDISDDATGVSQAGINAANIISIDFGSLDDVDQFSENGMIQNAINDFETQGTVGNNAILTDVSPDSNLIPYMQDQDLVISTLRPSEGQEERLVALTAQVLRSAQGANVRLIVVGGAARLRLPGKDTTVLTEPDFLPKSAVNIANACFAQSQLFNREAPGDWTHICPPAMLLPGTRTGTYRIGTDTLIVDKDGLSQISMEDFAVALIDEAETAAHRRRIITVAY